MAQLDAVRETVRGSSFGRRDRTGGILEVRHNVARVLSSLLGPLVVLGCSIAALTGAIAPAADHPWIRLLGPWVLLWAAWLGIVMAGAMLFRRIGAVMRGDAALIASPAGLQLRHCASLGTIPWSAIARLAHRRFYWSSYLIVVLRDPPAQFASLPLAKRLLYKLRHRRRGLMVPMTTWELSIDELLSRMTASREVRPPRG